ncbi:MAG: M23/M56 family metallopeptidase [Pseudomonadota bacterium]
MSALVLFIGLMILFSALLFGAARLFEVLDHRAQQWPALWATGLGLSVLIPLMGLIARAFPQEAWRPYTETLTDYVPLEPLMLPLPDMAFQTASKDIAWLSIGLIVLATIYAIGVCFMVIRLMKGRARVRLIITLARSLGTQNGTKILISRRISSPFAWSGLSGLTGRSHRRFIVLPDTYLQQMSASQIQDIIQHEISHLDRRDDAWGLVLRAVLCLCWISPFAHMLFLRWSQATEIRCDMVVTALLPTERRNAYAKTLMQALHLVAGRVRQHPIPAFSTPRLRTEKMRLTHILTGSCPAFKRGRDRAALVLAAIGLAVTGTLGIAATASADTPAAKAVNAVATDIVTGRLTASFGKAFDPFKDGQMRVHKGVDIAAAIGTPIYAPADGVICAATDLYQNKPAYGTVVVIETADGVMTLFSHLDGYSVAEGQRVSKGEQIATVGNTGRSTGPHVHIETYQNGEPIDPMTVWDLAGK